VEHAGDIVEELEALLDNREAPLFNPGNLPAAGATEDCSKVQPSVEELSGEERRAFDALSREPLHVDVLQRSLKLPPGRLAAVLLNLELKGHVQRMPGQYFSIVRMQ